MSKKKRNECRIDLAAWTAYAVEIQAAYRKAVEGGGQ